MFLFGSYWFLTLLCILSILGAVAGLWLVRRSVGHEVFRAHHDATGPMLSIVGTLYAVVLGLVVVGSVNRFESARLIVEHEANSLRDIFALSVGLPAQFGHRLRKACWDYATIVTGEEWELMAEGKSCRHADQVLGQLIQEIVTFNPGESGASNLQASLLSQVNKLDDSRASRLMLATPSFDPIIWTILIFGGVVLVVFTYFFGFEDVKIQYMATGLVTVVLSLNLVVVSMFGYPFSGDVRVWPVPLQSDLQLFGQVMNTDSRH